MSDEKKEEISVEAIDKCLNEIFKEQSPRIIKLFDALYEETFNKIDRKDWPVPEVMARVMIPYQTIIMDMFLKTSTMGFAANLAGPPDDEEQVIAFADLCCKHALRAVDNMVGLQKPEEFIVGGDTGLMMSSREVEKPDIWKDAREV